MSQIKKIQELEGRLRTLTNDISTLYTGPGVVLKPRALNTRLSCYNRPMKKKKRKLSIKRRSSNGNSPPAKKNAGRPSKKNQDTVVKKFQTVH